MALDKVKSSGVKQSKIEICMSRRDREWENPAPNRRRSIKMASVTKLTDHNTHVGRQDPSSQRPIVTDGP